MPDRKEYIERGALRNTLLKSKNDNTHHTAEARLIHAQEHNHLLNLLENMPAADVVEVVRCSQCKHWHQGDCYRLELSRPDDYCSWLTLVVKPPEMMMKGVGGNERVEAVSELSA